jgi:hypothetical protein
VSGFQSDGLTHFSGDVVFTDHFMRRLRERYGVRPKRKQRSAAARAMLLGLLGLLGEPTERSHFMRCNGDGTMVWRLDISGCSVRCIIRPIAGRVELITALPRVSYDFQGARE